MKHEQEFEKEKSSGMGILGEGGKSEENRLLTKFLRNTCNCDGENKKSLWKKASEREKG